MSFLVVFVEATTLVENALLMASRVQSAVYSIITPKSVSKLPSSSLISPLTKGLTENHKHSQTTVALKINTPSADKVFNLNLMCCNVGSLGGSLVTREIQTRSNFAIQLVSTRRLKRYSLHYYMVSEVNPQISQKSWQTLAFGLHRRLILTILIQRRSGTCGKISLIGF